MTEKPILCVECRSTFSEKEIANAAACPVCRTQGIPADTREKHTLTLTDHEWRILFMWAENHAISVKEADLKTVMAALRAEAKRQNPSMPNLTVFDDLQDMANASGSPIEVTSPNGDTDTVQPQSRH